MPISFGQFIVFISILVDFVRVFKIQIKLMHKFNKLLFSQISKIKQLHNKGSTTVLFGYKSNLQKYQVLILCHWIKQRLTSNV